MHSYRNLLHDMPHTCLKCIEVICKSHSKLNTKCYLNNEVNGF